MLQNLFLCIKNEFLYNIKYKKINIRNFDYNDEIDINEFLFLTN